MRILLIFRRRTEMYILELFINCPIKKSSRKSFNQSISQLYHFLIIPRDEAYHWSPATNFPSNISKYIRIVNWLCENTVRMLVCSSVISRYYYFLEESPKMAILQSFMFRAWQETILLGHYNKTLIVFKYFAFHFGSWKVQFNCLW